MPHLSTTLALLSLLTPLAAAAAPAVAPANSPCATIPHEDHPHAFLTNGTLDAQIFLPDAKNGYYRGSRFDWAGVVPCLAYQGHTYFGEWFNRYDPLIADAITGPVEEFRPLDDGGIGYNAAKPGEPFVKIGVGILRKLDDKPYSFMAPYPILDGGKRTVKIRRNSIVFTQRLKGPNGVAYLYTKTLTLVPGSAVMTLEHTLKNLGSVPIDTEVYDHDFFMLDRQPTGPAMVVSFPFQPVATTPMQPNAEIQGNDLVYLQPLGPRRQATSFLTGYTSQVSDYNIKVHNKETGVAVEQTADLPISKFNFWSTSTTICPEAYIHLTVAPGQTGHYILRYRFAAATKVAP